MDLKTRIDRREWLARMGILAAGVSGVVFSLRRGVKVGAVTPAGLGKSASAVRVNLGFVSAYVVTRGDTAALVDTGVAGSADRIGEVLQATGLGWHALQHLILTHHHPDHQGSAADVLARAPHAELWVGEADIPQITVQRRIHPANDGDEIFGLRVVATPGHTLGHISLFDPELGTLIIGDAVFNVDNNLALSPPQFTADQAQAQASVGKMAGIIGFERALFGHGDPIESGAAAAFRQLGARLP